MEKVVRPTLEHASGLKVNEDFYLACCPERVAVGRLLANLEGCSRVVGGMSPEAARLTVELYRHVVKADLDPTDCLTAELVKTVENTYRDVQIAFANIENSDDTRDTPTIPLLERLEELGAETVVHDPYVKRYATDLAEAVREADCIVVMVAHDQYRQLTPEYLRGLVAQPVLIDGRDVFDKGGARGVRFVYKGVGNV